MQYEESGNKEHAQWQMQKSGEAGPASRAYEQALREAGAVLKPELLENDALGEEFDRELKKLGETLETLRNGINLVLGDALEGNTDAHTAMNALADEASALHEAQKGVAVHDETRQEIVQYVTNIRNTTARLEGIAMHLKDFTKEPERLADFLNRAREELSKNIPEDLYVESA